MSFGLGLTQQLLSNYAAHGKYYNGVSRDRCFMAAMQAGASLGTALTATAVTLTLYNPSTSGVRLVVLGVRVAVTTVPSGAGTSVYVHAINYNDAAAVPATVTGLTVYNCLLGSDVVSAGVAYSAATLPATPKVARVIGGLYWASAAAAAPLVLNDEVEGAIILPPNTALTVQGIGVASSGIASVIWEEVPFLS